MDKIQISHVKWLEAEFWLYWAIVRAKWALAESESP